MIVILVPNARSSEDGSFIGASRMMLAGQHASAPGINHRLSTGFFASYPNYRWAKGIGVISDISSRKWEERRKKITWAVADHLFCAPPSVFVGAKAFLGARGGWKRMIADMS